MGTAGFRDCMGTVCMLLLMAQQVRALRSLKPDLELRCTGNLQKGTDT